MREENRYWRAPVYVKGWNFLFLPRAHPNDVFLGVHVGNLKGETREREKQDDEEDAFC